MIVVDTNVIGYLVLSSGQSLDCEFITVANELRVALLTSDKQLLQKIPEVTISFSDF